ncbi:hypothetical protein A8E00_10695, partial [Burkholderia cenocepacia]
MQRALHDSWEGFSRAKVDLGAICCELQRAQSLQLAWILFRAFLPAARWGCGCGFLRISLLGRGLRGEDGLLLVRATVTELALPLMTACEKPLHRRASELDARIATVANSGGRAGRSSIMSPSIRGAISAARAGGIV